MTRGSLDSDGHALRVLRASGELDITVTPAMLSEAPELVAGATGVLVDATEVTFFDSSAVRLVNRIARECGRIGAPLRVVAPPGNICRRVLELVGMAEGLVVDDVAAGVAAVSVG